MNPSLASSELDRTPLGVARRPLAWRVLAVLTGTLVLAAASRLTVPMIMQTPAVTLIGKALCLAIGGAGLAAMIGSGPAMAAGVASFVLGGLLTAAIGALALKGVGQRFAAL